MTPENCEWANYLITFNMNHFEMGGLNPDVVPSNVLSLLTDNIRLSEIKRNKEEAEAYGVDHLF